VTSSVEEKFHMLPLAHSQKVHSRKSTFKKEEKFAICWAAFVFSCALHVIHLYFHSHDTLDVEEQKNRKFFFYFKWCLLESVRSNYILNFLMLTKHFFSSWKFHFLSLPLPSFISWWVIYRRMEKIYLFKFGAA
jgi:hypothetical protein